MTHFFMCTASFGIVHLYFDFIKRNILLRRRFQFYVKDTSDGMEYLFQAGQRTGIVQGIPNIT